MVDIDILTPFLYLALIIIATVAVLSAGIVWFFMQGDPIIKSEKMIVPEIELVIKDNRVDTVFVYRQP